MVPTSLLNCRISFLIAKMGPYLEADTCPSAIDAVLHAGNMGSVNVNWSEPVFHNSEDVQSNYHPGELSCLCMTNIHRWLMPSLHRASTFVLPLCDQTLAKSPLESQTRPNGFLGWSSRGRSNVVHRMFRHRPGRNEVLKVSQSIAQRSPTSLVVHRSFKLWSIK